MELSRGFVDSSVAAAENVDLKSIRKFAAQLNPAIWIISAAFAALLGKLALAYNTIGTNDVAASDIAQIGGGHGEVNPL